MSIKGRVACSFSRAASTYDAYAGVQADVADELAGRIRGILPERILEIGCGTGSFTRKLAGMFADAEIMAIDISSEMVAEARKKISGREGIRFEQVDGESLDCRFSGPYDLIVSSGALHWFEDLGNALVRYGDLLAPGGVVAAAVFGSGSLIELQKTLERMLGPGAGLPVGSFPGRDMLEGYLARAFSRWAIVERKYTRRYPDLLTLLKNLKNTGVAPVPGNGPVVRSWGRIKELEDQYTRRFGQIKATYQVFFFQGRR
ncbi:MAG TPA: methyltransferase [Thermodesulfobacteriaceae bacterium]|nr:methyltransferase [Thermodesulfobacteriaceae bacterium]